MNEVMIKETLEVLAKYSVAFTFMGDENTMISKASPIGELANGSIYFFRGDDLERIRKHCSLKNLMVLKGSFIEKDLPPGNFIFSNNPDLVFCVITYFLLNEYVDPQFEMITNKKHLAKISSTADISPDVVIGDDVEIEDFCTVSHAILGNGIIIRSGAKIGGSGLGSVRDDLGRWHDFPHFGQVVIGSNVVIQENTVIHRGSLNNTIISNGTRIGSLCWIGHGVSIGEDCFINQNVTIAGSTQIGARTILWGKASIKDNVIIGEDSVIGMGSVVITDVPAGEVWAGVPARFIRKNENTN